MIKKNDAFTLTELLVAITIVFLLLGIILYAANGARDSSHTTLCATNISQLSKALSLYVSDYDSAYPVAAHAVFKSSGDGRARGKGTSWYYDVFPYANGHDQKNAIHCPSVNGDDILSSIDLQGEWPPGYTSGYAYNLNLSETIYDPSKREPGQSVRRFNAKTENEIDYSSLVVAFAEARVAIVAITEPDIDYKKALISTSFEDIIKKQQLGAVRHHGGANYTFIDGHVKWFKPEQLSKNEKCDGKTPGFGL